MERQKTVRKFKYGRMFIKRRRNDLNSNKIPYSKRFVSVQPGTERVREPGVSSQGDGNERQMEITTSDLERNWGKIKVVWK